MPISELVAEDLNELDLVDIELVGSEDEGIAPARSPRADVYCYCCP